MAETKSTMASLLVAGITLSAGASPALALDTTGRYCDTPSRCINPMATQGMVTSSNYLATQAGLDVLRNGGNAVDAAITVAATTSGLFTMRRLAS
ncbi:hypothetical protein [Azospirillum baldaniorum]|uniref:hypothetical protein n=1 Tax=Azospirillum baldaniorum TaxID=1064539 RepID=UPI00200016E3|nr:hypothetical protein [Azospirillum baldaniorum]